MGTSYADAALLIIDVQNDFCPGGALAVPDGDAVVAVVNRIGPCFGAKVLTQDWHPAGHSSFASVHPGKEPMTVIEMPYGPQTLWPDHCVRGTEGAALHANLELSRIELVIRKGFRREVDSYSAFFENDQATPTGLTGYLRERGFVRIVCVGLAYDFCVRFSAIDAVRQGFECLVYEPGCRAIDLEGSRADAGRAMASSGVGLISQ